MSNKIVNIITIPLVCYHTELFWGLYTEQHGKAREEIKSRGNAGKQVPYSFSQGLKEDGDILFAVDDKFNFERTNDDDPTEIEVSAFLSRSALPKSWIDDLSAHDAMKRIVTPPDHLMASTLSFSEKKLYAHSRREYGLPGECANEWAYLLEYLQQSGYEKIRAYIPKMCSKGICYATPYAHDSGIWENPICINFTDNNGVYSVYEIP